MIRGAGLALAMLAVVASAAEAATVRSGPVRYVTASGTAGAGGDWEVEAVCPNNTALAGGGGAVGGGTSAHFSILSPLFVLGGDSEFHSGGYNSGAAVGAKSVAICLGKGRSNVVAQGQTGTIMLDSFKSSTPCPDATRIIGGGVRFDGDPDDNAIVALGPEHVGSPDRFGFSGLQEGAYESISRSAICLENDDPRRLRYKRNKINQAPLGRLVRIKAKCPKRSWVLAGGLGTLGDAALKSSRPADGPDRDRKPDDAWRGALITIDSRVVGITAVCLKRPR